MIKSILIFLVSDENRKLMEGILAKSQNEQQEIGSRVAMLLAGTSLSTTSGVEIRRREPVEEIGYETVGKLKIVYFVSLYNIPEIRKIVLIFIDIIATSIFFCN